MKAGAGQQPFFRRSTTTTRKGGTSPERPVIVGPGSLLRLCLHAVACIASLVLGFRFSREALLVLVLKQPEVAVFKVPTRIEATNAAVSLSEADVGLKFPYVSATATGAATAKTDLVVKESGEEPRKSSRVHVGRHEILVRPWPHPDRTELYKAHSLLEIVQREQRSLYGPKNWRPVIAITPTFARTFQAIHLRGLMHTLEAVPGSVLWIVVEAGGRSNETGSLLASSNLRYVHLGVKNPMPVAWEQRRRMETRLRVEGLRYVRRERLDGVVVFADDSNVHSLQLFDEVQKVEWVGALSVGLLETSASASASGEAAVAQATQADAKPRLPVQGPACNETGQVIGWHALRAFPVDGDSFVDSVTDVAGHLEWSGFVLNARAVWEEAEKKKPRWIRDWNEWIVGDEMSSIGSPLRLARDQVFIEALGNCGREVLLWWIRVEARADSRYPSRWVLESPLEMTVAAKRTPWPEFILSTASSKLEKPRSKLRDSSSSQKAGARRRKKRQDNVQKAVEGQEVL